jgi:hypothetical protein
MAHEVIPNRGKMVYVKAKKTKPYEGGHWSEKVKLKAADLIMQGLTTKLTAIELNVPYKTIEQWRIQPWFKEIVKSRQEDDNNQIDNKLTKIMHTSLDVISDRLSNGEQVRDEKTGKIVVVPVKLRDANTAFTTLMDKRQLIRKLPTQIKDDQSVNQQLQTLANEFKKFVGKVVEPEKFMDKVIEGEHVFINEDGTGEWIEDQGN